MRRPSPSSSQKAKFEKYAQIASLPGFVLSTLGKAHEVEILEGEFQGQRWICRPRGRLFLKQEAIHPVAGDRVDVEPAKEDKEGTSKKGAICAIHERKNALTRRAPETGRELTIAANLDQAIICLAAHNPPFRPGLLDRYLATCEAFRIPPLILINKIDLLSQAEVLSLGEPFRALGYPVLYTSTTTGQGLDQLRQAMSGHLCVLTGPSGAGKSSIVNALDPSFQAKTGEVNAVTGKGRHTTTVAQVFPFLQGYIMDTPGVREFSLFGIAADRLSELFIDFLPHLHACRFRNCTHTVEPGCAIKNAVAEGLIAARRYEGYTHLRQEILEASKGVYPSDEEDEE